ncbi:MAG: hypothetical protein LH468_06920 [Nocardioides sp.]|nr:hypothetical protein [Nocardioides sp.]
MPRRVSLPSADDLFRTTESPGHGAAPGAREDGQAPARVRAVPDAPHEPDGAAAGDLEDPAAARRPSGRVRHDEKMTVYITSEELVDIEHARLSLRRSHGLVLDRGRLVREAVALVLADLETHGEHSALVRRLSEG